MTSNSQPHVGKEKNPNGSEAVIDSLSNDSTLHLKDAIPGNCGNRMCSSKIRIDVV